LFAENVRVLLGLAEKEATVLFEQAQRAFDAGGRAPEGPGQLEVKGKAVCFTGSLACHVDGELATRRMARDSAEAAGMSVQSGVTKSLDYLVVADPETMSGKAKKARQYGTRIIAESVFWRMVNVAVE
jgi:NAD-dependent DNA ligase